MSQQTYTPFVPVKALECCAWHGGRTVARIIPAELVTPSRRSTDSNWRAFPADALFAALSAK